VPSAIPVLGIDLGVNTYLGAYMLFWQRRSALACAA
jgi:hypothetical protein